MPNLSPVAVREKYKLYDNKICTGDEAAECRDSAWPDGWRASDIKSLFPGAILKNN